MTAIHDWARITRSLKDARKEKLKELGTNERGLRDLEEAAMKELGADFLCTEFGTVQKIYDLPVAFYAKRSADDTTPTIKKRKLKLITKED